MPALTYHHVDVFTEQPFGGNQLAVFTDGRGLTAEMMQQIAKEMNFSETTFVLPPKDPQNDFWVRIFTPAAEMPMAGHPTVGTAFVLRQTKLIPINREIVRFEEGVGVIPIQFHTRPDNTVLIEMSQPLPSFGDVFQNRAAVAEMLSIERAHLHPSYPIQVVSCGVPFLYVPIKDMETMRRLSLQTDVWRKLMHGWKVNGIFAFTMETKHASSTVHSRMFAPNLGVPEDPATGAASGPLGCYLVQNGIVSIADSIPIISEQGYEMGRPSTIYITIDMQGSQISGVRVGGTSTYMGEGTLYIS